MLLAPHSYGFAVDGDGISADVVAARINAAGQLGQQRYNAALAQAGEKDRVLYGDGVTFQEGADALQVRMVGDVIADQNGAGWVKAAAGLLS